MNTLAIRNMEELRPELELLVNQYASEPVELRIVPDIAEWASGRSGNLFRNPVALAVRDSETNGAAILLRREITEDRAESIVLRILLGGHLSVRKRIDSPTALARHLVLHELAHLVNDWGQEYEDKCDAWAFDRLQQTLPNQHGGIAQ
jgi:hypothetical protein